MKTLEVHINKHFEEFVQKMIKTGGKYCQTELDGIICQLPHLFYLLESEVVKSVSKLLTIYRRVQTFPSSCNTPHTPRRSRGGDVSLRKALGAS